MREEFVSFIDDHSEKFPFFIQMVGISYCDGSYEIKRFKSDIYVFEYILDGYGTVETNSIQFNAGPGDIYILHKESNHRYYSDTKNPWTKIWFNIRGTLIDNIIQSYRLNNVNHIKNLDLKYEFFKMFEIAHKIKDNNQEDFSEAALLFHEIIIKIYKAIQEKQIEHSVNALKIKNYIDYHATEKITIKELSKLIYRSNSQTIRIFKNEFKVTPYDYLMQKKIEISKLMLLNTNMSIKEISINLNFADEHYFSNYFKEKVKVSPLKFRKGLSN